MAPPLMRKNTYNILEADHDHERLDYYWVFTFYISYIYIYIFFFCFSHMLHGSRESPDMQKLLRRRWILEAPWVLSLGSFTCMRACMYKSPRTPLVTKQCHWRWRALPPRTAKLPRLSNRPLYQLACTYTCTHAYVFFELRRLELSMPQVWKMNILVMSFSNVNDQVNHTKTVNPLVVVPCNKLQSFGSKQFLPWQRSLWRQDHSSWRDDETTKR